MRFQNVALLAIATVGVAACTHDAGPFYPPAVPLAYVRWINAVPDTGSLDLRFIDQVENSPWYGELAFRGISNYQGAEAGTRHIRVFPGGSNDINVVTQIVLDTTLNLEAGTYYTILQTGYARQGASPKQHFVVLVDDRPSPSTSQIAVRAINGVIGDAVDVYSVPAVVTGTTVSGTALFSGVPSAGSSNYTSLATGSVAFAVTTSGVKTLMAQALAPAGHVPASISQTAQGGYTIGGSMLTAFIFPPSVTGSQAPQTTAFKTAAVVWMQDNRPGS